MPRKKHTPEQVINKLREAEVVLAQGRTVAEASRQILSTLLWFTLHPRCRNRAVILR